MNKATGLELLFELLRQEEIGTDPIDKKPWPLFIGNKPDAVAGVTIADSIALFDIGLPTQGRLQSTGETIGHEGIQIRVTSKTYRAGREKMFEIKEAMDAVVRAEVSFENDTYLIQAVHLLRMPVYIGQDENDRDSFTLDCSMSSRKVEV
jgi:hypothetical protein